MVTEEEMIAEKLYQQADILYNNFKEFLNKNAHALGFYYTNRQVNLIIKDALLDTVCIFLFKNADSEEDAIKSLDELKDNTIEMFNTQLVDA